MNAKLNGNAPAFPVIEECKTSQYNGEEHTTATCLAFGLTKREQMLITFMAAIAGGNPQLHPKGVANIANELADEALATIERWQQ